MNTANDSTVVLGNKNDVFVTISFISMVWGLCFRKKYITVYTNVDCVTQ